MLSNIMPICRIFTICLTALVENKMKIAFVQQPISPIRFPVVSSLDIWTYEVARRVALNSHVKVFARRGPDQKRSEIREGVIYRYIDARSDERMLRVLDPFSGYRNTRRPLVASSLYFPVWFWKTVHELSQEPWDVVHIVNFSQFVPLIKQRCPKAKIVLHMQCEWLNQLDRRMIERRLEKVDLIIGCSEYITNKIRMAFPRFAERCQTVYNGVDPQFFTSSNSDGINMDRSSKSLLFVGRVSPEKGVHVLIEALPIVLERIPHAQLHVIGSGRPLRREWALDLENDEKVQGLISFYNGTEYRSQLEARIRALGIEGRVHFHPGLPYANLPPRYLAADIFVFPSVWKEPFGMPLIEAMSCGLPTVASRGGGMTEIVVQGKTGLVVERADPHALAEALFRILADDRLAKSMGEKGRKRVLECFSWDRTVENLLTLYQGAGKTAFQLPTQIGKRHFTAAG